MTKKWTVFISHVFNSAICTISIYIFIIWLFVLLVCKFWSMKSILLKIGKCLSLCVGILFTVMYVIINYSHYLTYYLHVGFCTPLNKFTTSLENIYYLMDEEKYNKSIQEVWNKNYNSSFNGTLLLWKNPFGNII